MNKRHIQKIISRFVDIRPAEGMTSFLLFFYFFLLTSSIYIVKPVKISLYLKWLTFEKLPYAYFLSALFIGLIISLNSRFLLKLKSETYLSLSLGFFIISLFLFWILFQLQWPWLSMIFWFWSDLFIAASVTQFWILVNEVFSSRQARRLIGFLVSGGLLGGVAGSFLASRLAGLIGTENLLIVCPILLGSCLIIIRLLPKSLPDESIPKKTKEKKSASYTESFRLIRKNRHLVYLSGIVAAAMVAATLIDFQFNSVIENTFPDKDSRTAFLGGFFTLLLIFSYLFHVVLTSRILKNFGIRVALMIMPVILLIGSGAIFFIPISLSLYWAVFLKGGETSLSHSLSQSVRELLYIPIAPEIKAKAKVFIDMFVNKLAKGFGAVLIFVSFSVLHFSISQISLISIVFLASWIFLNFSVTREYVNIVKKNLRIKWQDSDKFISENIDLDVTKLVFDTLQSKEKSSVLYAMNLFDLIQKEKMSPQVKRIISSKSDEVRAASMDSLFELEGDVMFPEMEDMLNEETLDVQVKEIINLDVYQTLLEEKINKSTALQSHEAEVSKMEAAKILGIMEPTSMLISNLCKLLKDNSADVLVYAIESAGKLKKREFVPLILPHLSHEAVQGSASKALVEYGDRIVGTLKDYLGDPEENIQMRKNIPNILAQISTQKAARVLSLELEKRIEGIKPEIIEAMHRIKLKNTQVQFHEKTIISEILLLIKNGFGILTKIQEALSKKEKDDFVRTSEKDFALVVKHIFELLSLIYSYEDIMKAYRNICAGTKNGVEYSLELLDNILKKKIRDSLLPLIDDIPLEEKIKKGQKIVKTLDKMLTA